MAYTASGYFTGKDMAFAMFTTVPFGPDSGEFLAWFDYGGGNELMRDMLKPYNIHPINCGLISPEASGWFKKEIKTLDDLKGLKMRFFGLGASVMQKLGVATQLLQAGEIFQALQLGTIDATEFSMPTMDLSLGFHQAAKYYYFPGWHQQTSIGQLYINVKKWDEYSKTQKAIIVNSCKANMLDELSEGEAKQFGAMKELSRRASSSRSGGRRSQGLRGQVGRGCEGGSGQEPELRQGLGLATRSSARNTRSGESTAT